MRKIHWVFSMKDPRVTLQKLIYFSKKYDFELDGDHKKIIVYKKNEENV